MARRHRPGRRRPRAAAARGRRRAVPHGLPAPARRRRPCASCRRRAGGSAATTRHAATSKARCGRRWPPRGGSRSARPRSATPCAACPRSREALERMWPVLTPAAAPPRPVRQRGAAPARRATAILERARVHGRSTGRARDASTTCAGPIDDVALLDEARELARSEADARHGQIDEADDIRTYGHIVVDEVQDLTPMQLRMVDPPVAERDHDRRRRHRPGHRRRSPPTTGTTCCVTCPTTSRHG